MPSSYSLWNGENVTHRASAGDRSKDQKLISICECLKVFVVQRRKEDE